MLYFFTLYNVNCSSNVCRALILVFLGEVPFALNADSVEMREAEP